MVRPAALGLLLLAGSAAAQESRSYLDEWAANQAHYLERGITQNVFLTIGPLLEGRYINGYCEAHQPGGRFPTFDLAEKSGNAALLEDAEESYQDGVAAAAIESPTELQCRQMRTNYLREMAEIEVFFLNEARRQSQQ